MCVANAECQAATSLCECLTGYFAQSHNSSKSTCEELIEPGESCEQNGTCVEHALCSSNGTCQCEDRYFSFGGNCKPLTLPERPCDPVADKCVTNAQCVPSDGNGVGPTVDQSMVFYPRLNAQAVTICKCAANYFPLNGACVTNKKAGEKCWGVGMCITGAVCSAIDGWICRCEDKYYRDDLDLCQPRVIAGKNCSAPGQCIAFAECNLNSSTCVCDKDYYRDKQDICQPRIKADKACTNIGQCTHNAECEGKTMTCLCNTEFYNEAGNCLDRKKAGRECLRPGQCVVNAECDNLTGFCQCDTGFYNEGGVCATLKPAGEVCKLTSQCTFNADCTSLVTTNSTLCRCRAEYFPEMGKCHLKIGPGKECRNLGQCASNAECDPIKSICECNQGYYQDLLDGDNKGTCLPLIKANGVCTTNGTCVANSVCDGGTCSCVDQYYARDGQCLGFLKPGAPCDEKDTCVKLSTCDKVSNTSGRTECICVSGYFVHKDECVEVHKAGQPCNGRGQCVLGAECRADLGWMCTCGPMFYEDSYGVCYKHKPAGSPCNATYECTTEAECRDDANSVDQATTDKDEVLCRCLKSYVAVNGLCVGDPTVGDEEGVPSIVLISSIIAALFLLLLLFALFLILFRRRKQKRQAAEESMSSMSDSGSMASTLKPPRPYLGYAVPFYMPPPPSINSGNGKAPGSDLALEFYRTKKGSGVKGQDVISASMNLDEEDI
ncbi:unnamed protein product [Lymnaea stagnalis]|uniref:EGF-like domain-containing protein n=1 Tax=Lymnaea stagnalis TaxID=6523 RepID=A0AAV2HYP3_LYMST